MNRAYECFLALTNTMHFTRAANKLFISQQALSDQISRLEAKLNVQLFIRKPRLMLTPEGKLLEATLYDIQRLENNLSAQLSDLSSSNVGTINIGMHTGRAKILMPPVLERFYKTYPDVTVNIISAQTLNYNKYLSEGTIDFYFGINAHVGQEMREDIIAYEPMCLITSAGVLETLFGETYDQKFGTLKSGADLHDFHNIPFIYSGEISQGQIAINNYLERKHLHLKAALILNDYTAQYSLLPVLKGACFCPKILAVLIKQFNQCKKSNALLHTFPLLDFHESLKLSLISYKSSYLPSYTRYLYDLIKETTSYFVHENL
jgi:DNA-binding transcriptional LysR family regulator